MLRGSLTGEPEVLESVSLGDSPTKRDLLYTKPHTARASSDEQNNDNQPLLSQTVEESRFPSETRASLLLLDALEPFCERIGKGLQVCKDMCEYYRKRISIESSYAQKSAQMLKEMPGQGFFRPEPVIHKEMPLLKEVILKMRESTPYIPYMHDFVQLVEREVIDPLEKFAKEAEPRRRHLQHEGKRYLRMRDDARSNAEKAREFYVFTCKNYDEAESQLEKVPKDSKFAQSWYIHEDGTPGDIMRYQREAAVKKAKENCIYALEKYERQVQVANDAQSLLYSQLLPPILEKLQQLEFERMDHLLSSARNYQVLLAAFAPLLRASAESIQITLDNYSKLEDWRTFAKKHPPGLMPPKMSSSTFSDANIDT